MVVCANANGNYTVSPWRRFQPESRGIAGSEEFNETVRVNNSCMFSLANVSGYHRCGEKIINLKAKVDNSSPAKLTFQSGTWSGNKRADLARKMFIYRLKKYIGAYAAAMNGIDILVFTAGIGENDPYIRAEVMKGLSFLGIELDEEANKVRGEERVISKKGSKVTVVLIPTDEELMIASDTMALI